MASGRLLAFRHRWQTNLYWHARLSASAIRAFAGRSLFCRALGKDMRHRPRLRKLSLESLAVAAGDRRGAGA